MIAIKVEILVITVDHAEMSPPLRDPSSAFALSDFTFEPFIRRSYSALATLPQFDPQISDITGNQQRNHRAVTIDGG